MTTTGTALEAAVHDLLRQQIVRGDQLGVQVSAYRNGELILDVAAGVLGADDPRPVQQDSLFNSFSTTKGVAATALHILADRGLIDYEAPVATYWPAFAANGKGRITVAQAMSHQGGLHALPPGATVDFLCDWDAGIDWIANATPAYEPGTSVGYHAFSYAWVVGGIVQGASGRHIKDVIREEIAEPLGIANEMYVGISDIPEVTSRLAVLDFQRTAGGGRLQIPPEHDFFKAMPPSLGMPIFNDLRVRMACLPSANGHFSARALAKMYGALANGGSIDGVRLVSPARIAAMQALQTNAMDRVTMSPTPKAIGFQLGGPVAGAAGVRGPRLSAFGHSGAGGSTAFADPEVGLAVAVTLNRMQASLEGEGPTFAICELVRTQLGVG